MSPMAFAGSLRGCLTPSGTCDRALQVILRGRLFMSLLPNKGKEVFLQPQRASSGAAAGLPAGVPWSGMLDF